MATFWLSWSGRCAVAEQPKPPQMKAETSEVVAYGLWVRGQTGLHEEGSAEDQKAWERWTNFLMDWGNAMLMELDRLLPPAPKAAGEGEPNDEVVARAMEALEGMAETWAERTGLSTAISAIPVNCLKREHQERASGLIRRLVINSYMEGLYAGITSREDGVAKPA